MAEQLLLNIKKAKLVDELVEEILMWENEMEEIDRERLAKGLGNAVNFAEEVITILRIRIAKRTGQEISLSSGPSTLYSPTDIYSLLIQKLNDSSHLFVDYGCFEYYRAVDKNDRAKFIKMKSLITKASLNQRIFVTTREAGSNLLGIRMFSNYNENNKEIYAKTFGRQSYPSTVFTYCPTLDKELDLDGTSNKKSKSTVTTSPKLKLDNAGISNGPFLPRIEADIGTVPYIDLVLVREEVESSAAIAPAVKKLILDNERNLSTFLSKPLVVEDIPIECFACMRIDVGPAKEWEQIGSEMAETAEKSLSIRKDWNKRGDSRDSDGRGVGVGNRVAMGGGGQEEYLVPRNDLVGPYNNFKDKATPVEELRELFRKEQLSTDRTLAAKAVLLPKLFQQEQQRTIENGETRTGVTRISCWAAAMRSFDAPNHTEAPNSEEEVCTAVGIGKSSISGPGKEGDASFIFGRLHGGVGVTIEGGGGTIFIWRAKELTHGTGSQWGTKPADRIRGGNHELGWCETRKVKVGSVFNNEKERIRKLREGVLSFEKDGQEASLEFDVGWLGGLTLDKQE